MSTMNPEIEARYKENRKQVLAQEARDNAIKRLKETASDDLESTMIRHNLFTATTSTLGHLGYYDDGKKPTPTLKIRLFSIVFVIVMFWVWLNG